MNYKDFLKELEKVEKLKRELSTFKKEVEEGNKSIINSFKKKLSSLDIEGIKEFLLSLEGSSSYSFYEKKVESIVIGYIKILKYLESKSPVPISKQPVVKKTNTEKIIDKYEGLKRAYDSLISTLDSMESNIALEEIKRMERRFNLLPLELIDAKYHKEIFEIRSKLSEYRNLFLTMTKSEKYGPLLKRAIKSAVMEYINLGLDNDRAESITNTIIDFLEDPNHIDLFETHIKRILAGRMKSKEFKALYDLIKSRKKLGEGFQSYWDFRSIALI